MKHYLTLIATFISLSILTACGGAASSPTAAGQLRELVSPECQANPFEQSCIEEFAELRSTIIGSCRDNPTADGCADASEFVCTITEDNPNGNPFDPLCNTEDREVVAARAEVVSKCMDGESDATSTICTVAVVAVCDDNAFEEICDTEQDYVARRKDVINECESADGCDSEKMTQVCTDNPYNTLCFEDNTFNHARAVILATCGTANESEFCPEAIKPLCVADPFDSRCDDRQDYITARGERTKACTDAGDCQADLVAKICKYNPYNEVLCSVEATGDTYNIARVIVKNSCRTEDKHPLCPELVLEDCTDNPFDTLCNADDTYTEARLMVIDGCRTDDTGKNCDDAIAHVCTDGGVLFTDTLCKGAIYNDKRDVIRATCDTDTKHAACLDVVAVTCADNPFAALCRTDETRETYEPARNNTIATCRSVSRDGKNCADALAEVCVGDALFTDILCNGDTYDKTRADQCANGSTNAQCSLTVEQVCNGDPFNALCDDKAYAGARKTACRGFAEAGTINPGCDDAVIEICTANPFDADVCYDYASNYNDDNGALDYATARNTAVSACEIDASGALCADATLFVCATNPYNTLCYDDTDAKAGDYVNARDMAIEDCRTEAGGALCADAIVQACTADVFDGLCTDASYTPRKITACIAGVIAGTADEECDNLGDTVINDCVDDPFAAACTAEGSVFADYVDSAQGQRFGYCKNLADDTAREADTLCSGGYVTCDVAMPAEFCGVNFDSARIATCGDTATVFDAVCDGGAYESDRIAFCRMNLFHINCAGEYAQTAEIALHCAMEANLFISDCEDDNAQLTEIGIFCDTTDPFDANCVGDYENQTAKQRECEAGSTNEQCINTTRLNLEAPVIKTLDVGNGPVDQADFADGIVSVTLNDAGDAVVAPTGSSLGDLSVISRRGGAGIKAEPNTNPDGFAIFTLVRNTELPAISTSWHATILATTNLGAPLATAPSTAIWPGHFNLSNFKEGAINSVDFSVDFGDGKIGFANDEGGIATGTDRPQNVIMAGLSLDISFGGDNADGLLTGTATVNDMAIPVRGLIGTEGAVAVFVKSGLAGGFTASNPFHGSYTPPAVEPVEPPRAAYVDATPSVVNYADWEGIGDYAPADSPNIDSPANGFLQGAASGLDTTGTGQSALNTTPPILYTLNFADATYGGATIGGDERDGLAVFSGTIPDGDTFQYAGVFSGTDLGAPVTGTDGATVIWNGRFISRGSVEIDKDFELNILFSAGGGGRLTAFVEAFSESSGNDSDPYFAINASFDASGIITLNANNLVYDYFTNNEVATPVNGDDRIEGTLASIIGEDGALGVFHGASAGGASWAGGFVAAPPPPTDACTGDTTTDACRVLYSDWTTSLSPSSLPATAVAGLDRSIVFQYLQGTTERQGGLNTTGIRTGSGNANPAVVATTVSFNNSTFNGNTLETDTRLLELSRLATGGVAFVRGWSGDSGVANTDRHHYFATLFSNTDVGAPVVGRAGAAAIYNGRFVAIDSNTVSAVDKDFSLTVRFATGGGGRLSAFIADDILDSGVHFRIDGAFDPQGVITPIDGNIIFAGFTDNDPTKPIDTGRINGTLTGLIGARGAVGTFYGGVPSSAGIAGGFVALPEALAKAPPTANYNIWLERGGNGVPVRATTNRVCAGFSCSSKGRSEILRAPNQNNLDATGVQVTIAKGLSLNWAQYSGTPLGGDLHDSVAFFAGWRHGAVHYYAGVLAGADLGAPLTNSAGTSTTFYGQISILRQTNIEIFGNIDLAINFDVQGAGRIGGAFQGYNVQGRFDKFGIVTGRLIRYITTTETERYGTQNCAGCFTRVIQRTREFTAGLSGLIGAEGVVAGFAGATYGGGFVAIPNQPASAPPPIITHDTWRANPTGRGVSLCPFNNFNNQFLRISPQNGGEALSKCDVNVDPDTGNDTTRRHVSVDINRRLNPNTGLTGGITYLHGLRDWDADWQNGDYDTTGALRVRYAGIHPDTNVGELLPRAASYNNQAVGTWKGVFVAVRSGLAKSSAVFQGSETPGDEGVTFGLNVNYNERTLAIHPDSASPVGGLGIIDYAINGTYDDNGIISGSVSNLVEDYPNAILTGVIGRKGAVGIFASPDNEFGSVGGFVACPTDDPANGGNGACTTLR